MLNIIQKNEGYKQYVFVVCTGSIQYKFRNDADKSVVRFDHYVFTYKYGIIICKQGAFWQFSDIDKEPDKLNDLNKCELAANKWWDTIETKKCQIKTYIITNLQPFS